MAADLIVPPTGIIIPSVADVLAGTDFSGWIEERPQYDFLKPFVEQADVGTTKFKPLTVAERLAALANMGFIPHGHFEPSDPAMRKICLARLEEIGNLENDGARIVAYTQFQRESTVWFENGVAGKWTGQQMVVRSGARFRIVACGRRWGKALSLDTKLPTPDGWTTMGQVQVGDTLYDEHGQPTQVTEVHPIYLGHDCYDVHFSDGSVVTADAGHLWTVESKAVRRSGKPEAGRPGYSRPFKGAVTLTTAQLAESLTVGTGRESNYSVPPMNTIEGEERLLPVDPYVLGVWLGDGTSANAGLTCVDDEIVTQIGARGYDIHPMKTYAGKAQAWWISGLSPRLRELGVLGNKHIPAAYMRASKEQRLDLLRGLMDTDGYVEAKGHCEFLGTNEVLVEGVRELLATLGQRARICEGRATLRGRDCGPKFRMKFSPSIQVFLLPRKVKRQRLFTSKRRYITNIVARPSVAVRCIKVDAPSHLFLAGNFIPTHNTELAAHEILAVALTRPKSWSWCVGPTMKLADRLFEKVTDKLRDMGLLEKALVYRNTTQEKLVILENRSKIEGISAENYLSMAGAAVDLAVVDECAQIYPEAWFRGVLPPLSDKEGHSLLISSLEGDGDFFSTQYKRAERAHREALERGEDTAQIEWDFFRSESWLNFFAFPQGRASRAMRHNELNTPPQDFLEQYGATIQPGRDLVYPEFRMSVHSGHYPYDPDLPVIVTADPSGGSNPYALAVLQEHPEKEGNPVWMVDEVYELHMTVKDLANHIDRRPWVHNVSRFILDSAPGATQDLLEWTQLGFPAEAVYKKPPVWERLPLFRNLLRDPGIFFALRQLKANEILAEMGYPPDTREEDLTVNDQQMMLIRLEEMLDDARLAEPDRIRLQNCSHFFVDQGCLNLLQEIRSYRYNRKRQLNLNMREVPRDYANHLMDALGYYVWQCRRVAGMDARDFDTIMATTVPIPLTIPDAVADIVSAQPYQGGFLASMRARYDGHVSRDYSLLRNG